MVELVNRLKEEFGINLNFNKFCQNHDLILILLVLKFFLAIISHQFNFFNIVFFKIIKTTNIQENTCFFYLI